ncbi:MAG TPA: winged helix-turn-helix domain-containing protein [Blastocatellia bacterium]|nr:winged helix-turn-helix domain-containing protein [Blastocatellia bacterium]
MTSTITACSEAAVARPAFRARFETKDLVTRLRLVSLLQPMSLHAEEVTALAFEAAAEIARLRGGEMPEIEHADTAAIDWQRQEVVRNGARVPLTGCEWLIFSRLVKSAGKLVTRGELLDEIYWCDPSGGAGPKMIDVYICRLRKKSPWPITAVRGRGYVIDGCRFERPPVPLPRAVAGVTRERLMAGR